MKIKAALGLLVLALLVAGFLQMVKAFREAPPLSPLSQAARQGDVEAIRKIVESGVSPDERKRSRGWTPLMHAIHQNQERAARALIAAGANVDETSGTGLTALMLAAAYGRTGHVQLLLQHGADPHITKDGLSALDFAMLGPEGSRPLKFFDCQYGTVAALRRAAPSLKPRARVLDRTILWLKRCRY